MSISDKIPAILGNTPTQFASYQNYSSVCNIQDSKLTTSSVDLTMNSNSKDTNGSNALPSDSELARLESMINSEQEQSDELTEKDVAEILAQLNDAELVAQRMESGLDQLNERLDGIIEGLEAAQLATETTTEGQTQSDVSEANQVPPKE